MNDYKEDEDDVFTKSINEMNHGSAGSKEGNGGRKSDPGVI